MNTLVDILGRTFPGKDVLQLDEAAAYIGISANRLYALCSKRQVTHYRTGRSVYFRKSDLDAYMCSGERRAALSEAEAAIEGRRLAKLVRS